MFIIQKKKFYHFFFSLQCIKEEFTLFVSSKNQTARTFFLQADSF